MSSPVSVMGRAARKPTIVDAIRTVMLEHDRPMSVSEIYTVIIRKKRYKFNTNDPLGVVGGQLRRHTEGTRDKAAPNEKYFVRIDGRFALIKEEIISQELRPPLIPPKPTVGDVTSRSSAKHVARNHMPLPVAVTPTQDRVFIVHGRDDSARNATALFIRRLGFEEITLDEKPSAGKTIIEKFEKFAAGVAFAIVLLTPDDVGGLSGRLDQQQRARQNVIFELGWFAGHLGRDKVCLLRKGDVDIPTDLHGIVYIDMDARNGWQVQLAREMDAAGMNVDFNRLK